MYMLSLAPNVDNIKSYEKNSINTFILKPSRCFIEWENRWSLNLSGVLLWFPTGIKVRSTNIAPCRQEVDSKFEPGHLFNISAHANTLPNQHLLGKKQKFTYIKENEQMGFILEQIKGE